MFAFSNFIEKSKIRLVVADDHAMFRQGLITLLKGYQDILVIGEASNGKELLKLLSNVNADIALLDIQMPVMNGLEALEVLTKRFPDIRVIMVSMEFNNTLLQKYIAMGIHGFVPKGCDIDVLTEAIYEVRRKGNCFDLSIKLVEKYSKQELEAFKNKLALSPREIEVLSLTCKGKSNKEIATDLFISERTVEFHKSNIYAKTGLKNPADLISYGIKNGLDIL